MALLTTCLGTALAVNGVLGDNTYELAPVEVIGEAENLFRLPGSGYRVDGQVLEDYQISDINRLLERVPGVYFREEDGFGLLANISLRGVDASRSSKLTLMEDGIPTAPAPYTAPAAYYTPTLGRMAGIEILKGTSQVRHGPHTTGGVINYLSTPLPGQAAGYLRLAGGTDSERLAHGWWGDRMETDLGTLDVLLELYHQGNDGFRRIDAAGDFGGSDDTGYTRNDAMVKLAWTSPDARQRLEFKLGASDLDADISYLGLSNEDFALDPYRRYAASREDIFDTNHSRSYLRYGLRLGPDWDLSLTGYYNTFHRNWFKLNDIRDLDLDGDGIVEGEAGGSPVRMGLSEALAGGREGAALEALKGERAAHFRVRANNRDYYLAGAELILNGTVQQGEWTHNPLLGARFHTDRIRRLQWHDLFAQSADGSWEAPVRSALGSDGNRRQETRSTALFLEDEITRGPWIFQPGIRFEFLDLEWSEFSKDGTNERLFTRDDSMEVWSAGMGTTYLLDNRRALFVNFYRGFSAPSPRAVINNGIEEETSNSGELGFRYTDPANTFSAEVVGFYTRYDDLIVIDNIGSGTTGGNDQQPVTENIGEVDSYGLELVVRGDLYESSGGDWSVPVSLTGTWTVAELDGESRSTDAGSIFSGGRDGSRLPYIPEFQVNLSLGLEASRWSAGLSASWRDSSFSTATETTAPVNPTNGQPDARYGAIPSVFLLDGNIRYAVNESLTLFATFKNILDREYLVSRHPHGPRAGAPRQLTAGLNMSF